MPFGILALVTVVFPGGGEAYSDACSSATPGLAQSGLSEVSVLGVKSFNNGTCADGSFHFHSNSVDCTGTLTDYSVQGAYCGRMIAAGGATVCTWTQVGSAPFNVRLFAGYDWNNDGHIQTPEFVVGPMVAGSFYTVLNTDTEIGRSSRIIGFPTNIDSDSTNSVVENIVGCSLT